MRIFLLLFAMVLTGASCGPELDDGYQFGDLTRMTIRDINRVIEARDKYCAYTGADSKRRFLRKAAVLAIRAYAPGYPQEGVCTDEFDKVIAVLRGKCSTC